MKRFFALAMAALLLSLAACGGEPPIEPGPTITEPPTPPEILTFTAQVNQLMEDGTPYSLITADGMGFSWLNIDQDNLPVLDFTPEFGQTVEVELVPGTLAPDGVENSNTAKAMVKSMKPAAPAVAAQYVRTNGGPQGSQAIVIESKKLLEEYYRANRAKDSESYAPDKYFFDAPYDDSKSFAEAMKKYDEAFFENNLLVFAVLEEPSGSNRHIVTGVEDNVISIKRIIANPGDTSMASWHIMVEISRAGWDGKEFTLDVTDGKTAQSSTTAPNTTTDQTTSTKPPVKPVSVLPAKQQKFESPAAGANDFAFRLSKALLQGNNKKNFVSSPYSVWLPLAALVNATNPAHKATLLNALGSAGFSETQLNEAATQMLSSLTNGQGTKYDNEYYHNPLRIANAIFVDKTVTLNKNFKKIFADSYQGSAQTVDFKSPKAVKTVNDWASKHTEGLIQNIIQEFDPDTVAAIANAIYFSDRWAAEFDPEQTKQNTFHGANGDTQAQFMLREGDVQAYYEDDKLQSVSLGFKSNGGMSILLPKDGDANALLSNMTSSSYEKIQNESEKATGKLLLPRFEIDSGELKLIGTLAALGVPLVDPSLDPLTGLIEEAPAYISDAVQKAVIKVDEKGTTAAAVTVMMMKATSMLPQPTKPFEMVCDKPFAFILYGNGGQILFTGVVNQL